MNEALFSGGLGVSVVLGRFDALLARGLVDVLREDPAVQLIGAGHRCVEVASVLACGTASTAIVDEVDGRSLRMAVRSIQPSVGIVVLVREPPFPCGMVLLEAEMSCLAANVCAEDVLAAVRLTAQGGCMFVSATGERVDRLDRRAHRILTEREIQVLRGLSERKSYGQIAWELGIDISTVGKHAARLVGKLRASSTRDLIGMPVPVIG